jgi:hypothetical protein
MSTGVTAGLHVQQLCKNASKNCKRISIIPVVLLELKYEELSHKPSQLQQNFPEIETQILK